MTLLKAFSSFSRSERWGITGIISLIIILMLIKICMHFFIGVKPALNEEQILAEWQHFKSLQAKTKDQTVDINVDNYSQSTTLFHFDPNTLDSIGFRRLGLS